MFCASPLADCTRDTIQAMNQLSVLSHIVSATKSVKMKQHNPYASKLLAPEDSVEFNSMLNSPLSARQSPLNWEARAFDPSVMYSNVSTPYLTQSLGSVSMDPQVRRPLFGDSPGVLMGNSPSDTPAEVAAGRAQVPMATVTQSSVTASPKKALGKVYVGGRPVVVPRYDNEVTVQMRHSEATFVIPDILSLMALEDETRDLVGLPVIVEGDRGEDFGVISGMAKAEAAAVIAAPSPKTEEEAAAKAPPTGVAKPLLKVLRVASSLELQNSEALLQREAEALEYCQACLKEVQLSVPIAIEGVVFQFDRKKLTVRYTSDAYVDFNDLTRMLHKKYNCRIWMDQLNRDTVHSTEKRGRRGEHNGRKSNPHHKGALRRREH
ncbi:hypothetical protein LSCM1_07013 [Leishmania martiniquensis]|uniref:PSP1 C-terminal domain-containing protein n=1 Tax=Leishmania martiniquensis TaxID=1580590 RepID=A0A836HP31_9TRYP|nr:hypothetical protein LSCM1_07013 [Leishmania martiniquensis]